jgi:PPOX class probable FMN-dependent enzyme
MFAERGKRIHTIAELESFGIPKPRDRDKVLTRLGPVHQEWLAATSLIFLATASAEGHCDVSPKGDPPGFVRVLDDRTIAIPERVGNHRMDGYRNILTNARVGTICLIPGRGDTLRINGRATLVRDAPFLDDMVVKGHRPVLALVIDIDEVFFHCPKAFRRAHAWDPSSWTPNAARSYAEVAMSLWRKGQPRAEVLAHYEDNVYNESLYPLGPGS